MKSEPASADVVIVGAGFSGTMAAAHLVRRGLSVVLAEGGGRAGRGIAYSTRDAVHLLNVPAAKMSAWSDAPGDFVDSGQAPDGFALRRDFGAYLRAILDQAVADGVELIAATVVSAVREGEGWRVTFGDGRTIAARALVLALGNQPPEPMRAAAGIDPALFIDNPWGREAQAAIERVARDGAAGGGGDVLVIGTGLTMVDTVLSLSAAGFGGRIVALSRRGQVPRGHGPQAAAPVAIDHLPLGDVIALWRWLRTYAAAVGWRGAVDSLRPHAHAIWRAFGPEQQRRFLRHARPYWDVHRHRIAPQIREQLERMISHNQLEVVAGRIAGMSAERGGVAVSIRRRGCRPMPKTSGDVISCATDADRVFAAVFNCTGPLGAMGRTRDPLLRQLIEQELLAIDRLGIGLKVEGESRAGPRLWALGPLTKGEYWEIVAVPDIRGQVARVADDIAKELAQ